jgi:hypothetical protein
MLPGLRDPRNKVEAPELVEAPFLAYIMARLSRSCARLLLPHLAPKPDFSHLPPRPRLIVPEALRLLT